MTEVKQAYRRLAKANHPDAAGEAALPRFLAIQSAYDQIAGPDGAAGRGAAARDQTVRDQTARRPWSADPDRAGATRRAYGGRTRRDADSGSGPGSRAGGGGRRGEPGAGPSRTPGDRADAGTAGPGGPQAPGDRDGRDGADGPDRPSNKATLGSTSYDGADREPFEPDWGGASWYGTTSGTYWTLNPKEYADPRKHGPEYQARARGRASRAAADAASSTIEGSGRPASSASSGAAGPTGDAAGSRDAGGPIDGDGPTGDAGGPTPSDRPTPPRPERSTDPERPTPTHTAASWWEAAADAPPRDVPGAGTSTRARARSGPRRPATPGPSFPNGSSPADDAIPSADAVARSLRRWLDEAHPGVGPRLARAIAGWIPIGLGIGWIAGEVTGCARFSAECDPAAEPAVRFMQVAVLVAVLLVIPIARIAAVATVATLLAVIPGAVLLLATSDPSAVATGRAALGWLMALAWLGGLAYGTIREVRRPRAGPSAPPAAGGGGRPVS